MTISSGFITGVSVGIELLGEEHGFEWALIIDLFIVRFAFYKEIDE